MKLTKSQLQAALDALSKANQRAQVARNKIYAHCDAVYGVGPGDVDNDEFIDACDGGCGAGDGMTAEEFDESMRRSMEMAGIDMPNAQGNPPASTNTDKEEKHGN